MAMTGAATAVLVGLVAGLVTTATAQAASFDCKAAGTAVEKGICASPTLGRLDDELGQLYQRLLGTAGNDAEKSALRDQQRQWLREERNVCTSAECLGGTMWRRAAELRAALGLRSGPSGAIAMTAVSLDQLTQALASENPAPAIAAAAPERLASNPSRLEHCQGPRYLSASHFALCDAKTHAEALRHLDAELDRALGGLALLPWSWRARTEDEVYGMIRTFLARPEALCPGLEAACVSDKAAATGRQAVAEVDLQRRRASAAREQLMERNKNRDDKLPVVVDNGGWGARQMQQYGGNFVALYVRNRTRQGLRQVDVACNLYEAWWDEVPVEPTELRYSIKGNIAPESVNFMVGPVAVPWDQKRYGKDAEHVRCRVTSTQASSAEETKAALAQREADAGRVARAREQMLAEGDRRRAEVQMDQTVRLRSAILSARQAAAAGQPACNALAATWTQQMSTIDAYQSRNLAPQEVSLVDGALGQFRQYGCLR